MEFSVVKDDIAGLDRLAATVDNQFKSVLSEVGSTVEYIISNKNIPETGGFYGNLGVAEAPFLIPSPQNTSAATNYWKGEFGDWTYTNDGTPVMRTYLDNDGVTQSIPRYYPITRLSYTVRSTNSKNYSVDNPDYIDYLLWGLNGEGYILQLRIYARLTVNTGATLKSRFSALNNRTMFTINVKDTGDSAATSLVQMYASADGKIHEDAGNGYAQDSRFHQTFVFGPLTTTPCQIAITNLTFTNGINNQIYAASDVYRGTCSSLIQANGFSAYSDYRIKYNIETLNHTHTVDDIRVVKYTTCDNTPHFGVIAHELSEVYPELVTGKKDDEKLQSVSYIELIPILINEVQTIKKELTVMKKENEQLLTNIEYLEQKLISKLTRKRFL